MIKFMLLLSVCSMAWCYSIRPSLTRNDMCGIWKLGKSNLILPSSLNPNQRKSNKGDYDKEEEVVLRLNEDGTFDPYTAPIDAKDSLHTLSDDLPSILGRGGSWEFRDETLILAVDRPEKSNPSQVHDTVFMGKLKVQSSQSLTPYDPSVVLGEGETTIDSPSTPASDVDMHLSIPQGEVTIGKFMYPKKHKAFFEEPILFKRCNIGTFYMIQVLGNLNTRLQRKEKEDLVKPEPKFKKENFHNRTFYLTTAPHPVNPTFAQLDIHYDESKDMMDVRVMPITFHSNNTFTAIGTEKILRGRFDITGDDGDNLYFRVSLFGIGRSTRGSVFSEGRLLSQDDRRAYVGQIQAYQGKNKTNLFVKGDFYYGYDKTAKKANSMGTFTLQEVDRQELDLDKNEEDVSSTVGTENDQSWDDFENAFQ